MGWTRVWTVRLTGRASRWLSVGAVVLAGALALSGCANASGTSPSTGSSPSGPLVSDAAVVAAAVTAAEQPVAWQLSSAPSITVGTGAQGKRVAVITKDINGFIQAIKDGISAAAGKVGMTTLQSNPAGNAADVARQISQAIAQHTSAIITVGFTTAEITAPLQQAHSAGIPVVQLFVTDPGAPPASATSSDVFAYVSPCYSCIGATMADIVIRDSGGRANTVFVNAPDVGVATLEANGFTAEMRQHCPSCTTKVSDAPIAQWGTQIPSIATAAAADPRVNYIVPVFDTASPLIVPALAAANATGRVKLVSSNGDQAQLQDMKAASTPRWVGNIGVNGAWIGWASMDEVLRALTNHPALADEKIGFRAFTPTNVGSLDLTQNPSTWYGGTDFAANYLKLWGLS
ncbi:MAG: sugar ABC transporter substrate-binding protein [Pseudonocardiaceae bacterium]